jgi:hypothetical protein
MSRKATEVIAFWWPYNICKSVLTLFVDPKLLFSDLDPALAIIGSGILLKNFDFTFFVLKAQDHLNLVKQNTAIIQIC